MSASVYVITNVINDKRYVGKTCDPVLRWKQHLYGASVALRKESQGRATLLLHKAMCKYGVEAFTFSVVEDCSSEADAYAAERHWIILLNSTVDGWGYNLTSGGIGGFRPCQETRAKLSLAAKGRVLTPIHRTRISAANKGKVKGPLTSETKAKLSILFKGKHHTPETLAKMSIVQKGKVLTPETRAKISAARTGQRVTLETRAKMSAGKKGIKTGRVSSPETRAKCAAAHRGKIHSADTRAKMSLASKGRPKTPEHIANQIASRRRNLSSKLENLARASQLEQNSPTGSHQVQRDVDAPKSPLKSPYEGTGWDDFLADHPALFTEEPVRCRHTHKSRYRRRN